MFRKLLALLLTAMVGVGILTCTPASAAPIIYAGDPVTSPSTTPSTGGMHWRFNLEGRSWELSSPPKVEDITITKATRGGFSTMAAQRVTYTVTCGTKKVNVWGDFERSGNLRRAVRGGFDGTATGWTQSYGRLGVVSYGATKVTDVRFNPAVITGSGYSTGIVADRTVVYVQVVPWIWNASQGCNGGLGWVVPAPQS